MAGTVPRRSMVLRSVLVWYCVIYWFKVDVVVMDDTYPKLAQD